MGFDPQPHGANAFCSTGLGAQENTNHANVECRTWSGSPTAEAHHRAFQDLSFGVGTSAPFLAFLVGFSCRFGCGLSHFLSGWAKTSPNFLVASKTSMDFPRSFKSRISGSEFWGLNPWFLKMVNGKPQPPNHSKSATWWLVHFQYFAQGGIRSAHANGTKASMPSYRAVGNGIHFCDTTERACQRLFCAYEGGFPKVSQKWGETPSDPTTLLSYISFFAPFAYAHLPHKIHQTM